MTGDGHMKQQLFKQLALVAAVTLAFTGCTMHEQETPALSGPSEFGLALAITIAPDVLTQDGASQSLVTITARDSNGQPQRNVSLRAEIQVGGVRADFGQLSARNLVTGSDGRATVVYTAPAAPSVAVDSGTIVDISITPVGTDFNNTSPRTAAIRLVPPGIVVPPDGLKPHFTFTPSKPTEGQNVLFVACEDSTKDACALANNPVASYSWTFGDGGSKSGKMADHVFREAGFYTATLTISDGYGRSASTSQSVEVAGGVGPSAAFTSSPSDPLVNQPVNFNASGTRAAPGRTIKSYDWDFGDGTFGQGVTASHTYTLVRSYTVVLTVTDDLGRKGTAAGVVTFVVVAPK
jgi:PKD repeat protein